MSDLVIKGGTLLDATGERSADIAISGGFIDAVGAGLDGDVEIDASGCYVTPGLVDLHTHLQEPGNEDIETIEATTRAAALGGYTAIVAMPDTDPVVDSASMVRDIRQLTRDALCDVYVAGAITIGHDGERLAPLAEMSALGVRLFVDPGRGIQDDALMRRALDYCAGLPVTLVQHCDNAALSAGGHMHEGPVAAKLGIPAIPAEAEELMILRDITLSRLTGGRIHFDQLSTAGSVGMLRAAKAAGLSVTAGVAAYHLSLTDEQVASFDPRYKVLPPLRPEADRQAVCEGVAQGVIDAVVSAHNPCRGQDKELPFDEAPHGVRSLETSLAVALTSLSLSPKEVVAALSWQPAAIAGIQDHHGATMQPGAPANLAVFDTTTQWVVGASVSASSNKSDPQHGQTLKGKVRHTLRNGALLVKDGEAQR